jgi:hypothetical protein
MKIYKIAQAVSWEYMPTSETPFIFTETLVDLSSRTRGGGTSNKEYTVRIYYYENLWPRKYAVIAFNGRIGGTMRAQFKGSYESEGAAVIRAREVVSDKVAGGYRNTNMADPLNRFNIPGTFMRPTDLSLPHQHLSEDFLEEIQIPEREDEKEEDRIFMWQDIIDGTHTIEEAIEQNAMSFMIESVRKIVMGESKVLDAYKTQDAIEEFIHIVLNSRAKDEVLKLPKEFFNKIGMALSDREMVQEYFQAAEVEVEDTLESLLAHRNWHKRVTASK